MQNLKIDDLTDEKQTRTTKVRHGDGLASLIKRASVVKGVDEDTFIRMAIANEAQRVINSDRKFYHELTPEDAEAFLKAEDKPPTPRALKAVAEHRRRVVNAN